MAVSEPAVASTPMLVASGAVLWLVVVARIGLVTRPGAPRNLWLTLVTITSAHTLQIPSCYRWLDASIASWVGIDGGAMLVKHSLALGAAANMLALVQALGGWPTQRRAIAVAAIVACWVAYILDPGDLTSAPMWATEVYGTSLGLRLHWLVFLAYLSWYLITIIWVAVRYRRQAAASALRTGMLLIAVGSTIGSVYVIEKLVILASWNDAAADRLTNADALAQAAILGVSLPLMAIGTSYEAISSRLGQVMEAWQVSRSVRNLTPLWKPVTALEPSVVLTTGSVGWRVVSPDRLLQELRLRRVRRIVEIRDAIRRLRPYASDDVRVEALREAERAGLRGHAAAAAAEAAWIDAAREGKTSSRPPTTSVEWSGSGHGGSDLTSEAEWLEQVARAYAERRMGRTAEGCRHLAEF